MSLRLLNLSDMLTSAAMPQQRSPNPAQLRASLGLSVRKAAKLSGIARNTIENVEDGGGQPGSRRRYLEFLRAEARRREEDRRPKPDDAADFDEEISRLRADIASGKPVDVEVHEFFRLLEAAKSDEERARIVNATLLLYKMLKRR